MLYFEAFLFFLILWAVGEVDSLIFILVPAHGLLTLKTTCLLLDPIREALHQWLPLPLLLILWWMAARPSILSADSQVHLIFLDGRLRHILPAMLDDFNIGELQGPISLLLLQESQLRPHLQYIFLLLPITHDSLKLALCGQSPCSHRLSLRHRQVPQRLLNHRQLRRLTANAH